MAWPLNRGSVGRSRRYALHSALGRQCLHLIAIAAVVGGQLSFVPVAQAAANLTITPLTWNVIGLDSNNVNVGPNNFPVGARVCNTGDAAATNVTATFAWDSSNTYINNRPGTNTTLSLSSLAVTTIL